MSKRSSEIIYLVNTETLTINGNCNFLNALVLEKNETNFNFFPVSAQISIPSVKDGQSCILFSDGDSLNAICSMKDVNK